MEPSDLIRVEQSEGLKRVFIAPRAINRIADANRLARSLDDVCSQDPVGKDCVYCIDLKDLTWISSAGLRHLIQFRQRVRSLGGMVRLENLTDEVWEVLQMTRLERVFDVAHTRDF